MTIRIRRSGLLCTVQDLGRPGLQHLAIVPGGAIDTPSHRVANALVGNDESAAALEYALAGPELEFTRDALVALHGARFDARIDGAPLPLSRPVLVPAGARVRVGRAAAGSFGYLAVAGGLDVALVLGSRSTALAGAFGGWRGRALAAGDELPLAADAHERARERFARIERRGGRRALGATAAKYVAWSAPALTVPATDPLVVRVVDGVHAGLFDGASRAALVGERWRVTPESNRMGYRLAGPKLGLVEPREIVSQPVCFGTVQVPAGGQPIVLMADRQTTGGYPRIAEVIAADVPRLAQAMPGVTALRFERATLEAADEARETLARRVNDLIERLRWEYGDETH